MSRQRDWNRFSKKICGFISFLLIVFFISIGLFLFVPKCLGCQVYNVVSGSMEPVLPLGTYLLVTKYPIEQIDLGDIIAFYSVGENDVITHRVVDRVGDMAGLVTKGDANPTADLNPVTAKEYIGKVVFSLPIMGAFLEWITRWQGKCLVILLIGVELYISKRVWYNRFN